MYPHPIRLREPWAREPREQVGLRLRRGFNRPPISTGEGVWIVCDGLQADAVVMLDDVPLGEAAAAKDFWERDVTALLTDHHELTFDFAAAPVVDGLPWREVRLEVRLAGGT